MVSKEILRPVFRPDRTETIAKKVAVDDETETQHGEKRTPLIKAIREACLNRGDLLVLFLDEVEVRLKQPILAKIRSEAKSRNPSFDPNNLLDRLSSSSEKELNQYHISEVLDLLRDDFRYFVDEYVLQKWKSVYFDSDQKKDKKHLERNDQYREKVDQMARNFVKVISKAKRSQQRALVENRNWELIQLWKDEMKRDSKYPVGSCLVVCSPPGGIIEGYGGINDAHSFVWIFRKVIKNGQVDISMTQVRCWPSLEQFEQLQKKFKQHEKRSGALPKKSPLPLKLTRRNQIIATILEPDPELTTEQIIDDIFETEETWQKKRSDLPNPTAEQLEVFGRYRDAILHLYVREAYFTYITVYQDKLTLPYDDPFWRSNAYRQIVKKLDDVLELSTRHLRRKIETQDIPDPWIDLENNSEPTKKELRRGLTKAQKKDQIIQDINPEINEAVADLLRVEFLKEKHELGEISSDEITEFNSLASNLLADLSGKTQCGIVGAATTPLKIVEYASSVQGINVVSMTLSSPVEIEKITAQLSPQEKVQALNEFYQNFKPLTIQTRHGEKRFWIAQEQFHEYDGKVYEREDGVIVGPCNVSMDNDAFVRSEEKYQALLRGTQTKPDKADESTTALTDETVSDEDKKYKDKEDRVDLTAFIIGDLYKEPSTGYNSTHGQPASKLIRPNFGQQTTIYQRHAA